MKNIPKTVQWLLGFANLGSKPGKLNISKLETKPKIKRPPTKPPPGIMSLPDQNLPHRGLDLNIESTVDAEGNTWLRSFGETIFRGKENFCPPLKEFKDFFLKWGILPVEAKTSPLFGVKTEAGKALDQTKEIVNFKIQLENGKVIYEDQLFIKEDKIPADENIYLLLKVFWKQALNAFHHICRVNETDLGIFQTEDALRIFKFCISRQQDSVLPFSHDNTLPFALYVYILDFWINCKNIHSLLKQCPCCGRFWIAEEKRSRGRPQTFCSEKCEDRFNQNSRQVDQDNKKHYRSYGRLKAKKDIINYLRETDFTQLKAEEIYNELTDKCKSSLLEFKRTWGQSHG